MTINHHQRAQNSLLLIEAAEQGNLEEIQRLIPISYPKSQDNAALTWAVNKNHLEGVKSLAPVCDVVIALSVAAEWGRVECLRILIDFANPNELIYAAGDAAYEGHMEALQFLLQHCDPKEAESYPLQMAAMGQREEIIDFLIPLSNPLDALNDLSEGHNNKDTFNFLQDILARRQKATIEQNIAADGNRALVRKI